MQSDFIDSMTKVINASGRMTKLGVSVQSGYVQSMMKYASDHYFIMDELYKKAGEEIAKLLGAADCVVTSSATSAISFTIASLICKDSKRMVADLPIMRNDILKNNVILPKGHNINYGAPIHTVIESAGGKVVEAGSVNQVTKDDVRECINENTLALMYVKSHHCVQKNMVSLKDMIDLANEFNIPILVDAAAEEDMHKYYDMGATFVIYSGSKALCGPSSGFVLCRSSEYANNMRLQYYGIGRSMKIGKENIFGLVAAVEEYISAKKSINVTADDIKDFIQSANNIDGITATLVQDEAGREIFRARLKFDPVSFGKSAGQVNMELHQGNPAIFARDYLVNLGYLDFDPRPLTSKGDLDLIIKRITGIAEEI